ncbi:MAG TPA: XRE family transcriptional regulator [Gaiellaceae bacterium]|nr:XRE family transcriptional regulator [Gaiellaceae bacterium]
MPLTREDLGLRIARARESAGLSQSELARRVGLSQSAVSRIESGVRGVDSIELAEIARVLDVAVLDLLETRPLAQELRVAARAQGIADSASLERAVDRVVELVRLDDLLGELGLPDEQAAPPRMPVPRANLAIDQGRDLARAVRADWNLGDDPLPDLLSVIEEHAGVGVLLEPLQRGLDGLCARTDDVALIVVDSSAPVGRQRFTAAHELCHLLLGEGGLVLIDERISAQGKPPEIRANAFASHFLMPREGIERYVGGRPVDERVAVELQFTFGVSLDALLWHLLNLELISEETRSTLSRRGAKALAYRYGYGSEWESQQSQRALRRPPRPLTERALAAYERGSIGLEVVARLIGRDDVEAFRAELEEIGIGGDARWWESSEPA